MQCSKSYLFNDQKTLKETIQSRLYEPFTHVATKKKHFYIYGI